MKKLVFGLMRLPLTDPNDEGSIDIEQMKQMVDVFLERGFTYFDTARSCPSPPGPSASPPARRM